MHTATRLTLELLEPIRKSNPQAHLCAYGLYAPLAAESLRAHGVESLLGGEFEQALVDLAEHLSGLSASPQIHPLDSNVSLARLRFVTPDRSDLPALNNYAHLVMPEGEHRLVGYTEASRGCKHVCRHCPIVPVYNGVFRIVDRETVLADIRQQVKAGAQHITFGDPDFFNGVGHAVPLVEALHREFPELTYDVTIKVEHLRENEQLLKTLRETGCLFIVSAVESLDNAILEKLQKGHSRDDFFGVVEECRRAGLAQSFQQFRIFAQVRSEEHTSELQSHSDLVCRLLLEKKKKKRFVIKALQNLQLIYREDLDETITTHCDIRRRSLTMIVTYARFE